MCIPLGRSLPVLSFSILSSTRSRGRQRLVVLPHEHDAFDHVIFAVAADNPQPRLVADHDLGDLLDVDRHVVVARHHDILDVFELLDLDRIGMIGHGWIERVAPFTQVADRPNIMRLRPQGQNVATDIGVGLEIASVTICRVTSYRLINCVSSKTWYCLIVPP